MAVAIASAHPKCTYSRDRERSSDRAEGEETHRSTMPFARFVQIGRVALVNYGKDYGKLVVVTDVIDQNRVRDGRNADAKKNRGRTRGGDGSRRSKDETRSWVIFEAFETEGRKTRPKKRDTNQGLARWRRTDAR